MVAMPALHLPDGTDGFTVEDLATFPSDGRRYEIVDGALLVSPSPRFRHQRVVGELFATLRATCPPELEVAIAPVDVHWGRRTSLQPDVMVFRRDAIAFDESAQRPPLLAVEVLSPSTRDIDAGLKRLAYARMGVPSYWLVDPVAPSITVLELTPDGAYREVSTATGEESVRVPLPFAVELQPSRLLGP